MRMDELDYILPPERIATRPAEPRDASRLMVVHADRVEHRHFRDIGEYLRAGDLLAVNETRVLPAKLALRRRTGAAIHGLFLREIERGIWEAMLRTRGKVAVGETLEAEGYAFELVARQGEGIWRIGVTPPDTASAVLQKIGHIPLPPYIERRRREDGGPAESEDDRAWYQTVFAQAAGASVAAPTAGLHFTRELLTKLATMGVQRAAVELEVGMGTFLPVETETLEAHPMHIERYHVSAATIEALRRARRERRRIIPVGTTAVRTLEATAAEILSDRPPAEIHAATNLKIAPGFRFQLTDALITNFHLPRSTLMALVAAFLGDNGVAHLKTLYAEAIEYEYRFYSYGDAMLIIP
jgi:S-adenosylmethionine:tRNA ribosyltransferase-isomerase